MVTTMLIIFLAAFISLQIKKHIRTSVTPKQKLLSQLSFMCLLLLVILIFFSNRINLGNEGDSLCKLQEYCTKNHLPQNDSTMLLESSTKDMDHYFSCSRDSVLHSIKIVEYDLMGIKNVTDYFHNARLKQSLSLKYTAGGWFRDSSIVYRLVSSDPKSHKEEKISKQDFERCIREWGLADKIYKEFKLNY